MANEIKVNLNVQLSNGNLKSTVAPGTVQVDQAAARLHHPVVTVGTSEETISFGDVTTPGYVYFRNLDATNYVTMGPDSTGMVAALRIEAGEVQCFRFDPAVTWIAQANTAAVELEMWLLQD